MGAALPTAQVPKWRRRKPDRPQEIMRAALDVFSRRGFMATRLDDVAEQAGISKGTLYLYYSSKEELFRAIVHASVDEQVESAQQDWPDMAQTQDEVRTGIIAIITDLANVMASPVGARISKLVLAEAAAFPDIASWYRDHLLMRVHVILSGLVEQGMAMGMFRSVPKNEAVRSLLAPVFMLSATLSLSGFQQAYKINPQQQVMASLDIWFRGMRADQSVDMEGR